MTADLVSIAFGCILQSVKYLAWDNVSAIPDQPARLRDRDLPRRIVDLIFDRRLGRVPVPIKSPFKGGKSCVPDVTRRVTVS
jgi:hypothetical protein